MRIIAKRTLRDFWATNALAEQPLLDWYDTVTVQIWQSPNDVKQTFASASIIDSNRVVFNIKGNDYRLVCHIDYAFQLVFVLWIGRHAEYDKIDVKTIAFKRKT